MSENATADSIVDVDEGFFVDKTDYFDEFFAHLNRMYYIQLYYFPCLIVIGVLCSILVLSILIRHRLWMRHEAYIYLAAILIVNSYKLIFIYGEWWLDRNDHELTRLPLTADVICKFWKWLEIISNYVDWLYVLMLLNVCLRQKLITSNDIRGLCANFVGKYCSLFGTKVVISSYFIVCALSTFWTFSIADLDYYSKSRICHIVSARHVKYNFLLMGVRWWFKVDIPLFVQVVLLLLIIIIWFWRKRRSAGNVFSQMNVSSQNNGDAEGTTRLVICCAVIALIISAAEFLTHILDRYDVKYQLGLSLTINAKLFDALYLIYLSYPLSTPIVCLTLRSRIRDELKTMLQRCCCQCYPGSRCHRTLPAEPDNNESSVIQMDPIEVESTLDRTENDSVSTIHQN